MYELVYWRFGTMMIDSYESKDEVIAAWVAGLDYNEFWSPGFVDYDQQIVFLPESDGEKSGLSFLEEGLGIPLVDFQIEFFEIPEP